MSTKDDLEAVRTIVAALDGFSPEEQERIIRWAREKVSLPTITPVTNQTYQQQAPEGGAAVIPTAHAATGQGTGKDLKSFVDEKKPKNDVQFAATVAYYHRFEVPTDKVKPQINSDDLQDACRLAKRERFKHPGQTLRNAHNLGLLDKGSEAGFYAINSVGENLVAMALPSDGTAKSPTKAKAKRTVNKKAPKQQRQPKTGKK